MNHLEKAIADWKRKVFHNGLDQNTADELETHLRDTVEELVSSGLSEEDAFTQAVDRLGETGELAREFRKVERLPLPDRIGISTLGIFGGLATVAILQNFLSSSARVENPFPLLAHVVMLTVANLMLFFFFWLGAYCSVRKVIARKGEGPVYSLLRRIVFILSGVGLVLTVGGVVLGCIWSRKMGNAIWSWDGKEIAELAVCGWYVASIVLLRRRGAIGNGVPYWLLSAGVLAHLSWFVFSGMGFTIVSIAVAVVIAAFVLLAGIQTRAPWSARLAPGA